MTNRVDLADAVEGGCAGSIDGLLGLLCFLRSVSGGGLVVDQLVLLSGDLLGLGDGSLLFSIRQRRVLGNLSLLLRQSISNSLLRSLMTNRVDLSNAINSSCACSIDSVLRLLRVLRSGGGGRLGVNQLVLLSSNLLSLINSSLLISLRQRRVLVNLSLLLSQSISNSLLRSLMTNRVDSSDLSKSSVLRRNNSGSVGSVFHGLKRCNLFCVYQFQCCVFFGLR